MSFSWFKRGTKNSSTVEKKIDEPVKTVVKSENKKGSQRNPGSSITHSERKRRTKKRKEAKKMRMLNRRNK